MKRLVIAAFIFGMATGYCGALWQICAQKAHARQEMRVSPAEAGSASVAAGGGSKVSEQSSSASVALTGSARGGHGWGKRWTGWTKNREMEDDKRG